MQKCKGPSSVIDATVGVDVVLLKDKLAQIQAESIGWIPMDEGAYLHVGSDEPVIQVVGIAKEEMVGSNVLWLT